MRTIDIRRLLLGPVVLALLCVVWSCQEDEPPPTPSRSWRVTYTVQGIGEITVRRITYLDEFGAPQTVQGDPDDPNFQLSIEAQSGLTTRLRVEAEATNGGLIATIDAQALDNFLDNEVASNDGGNSSGQLEPVDVVVELLLP